MRSASVLQMSMKRPLLPITYGMETTRILDYPSWDLGTIAPNLVYATSRVFSDKLKQLSVIYQQIIKIIKD